MKKLKDTFQKLGVEVETYQDLSSFDLKATVNELAQRDFKEYGSLVVCLLSHGMENAIACSDGICVNINQLKYEFVLNKCPSLYGKPKIFIVQACQGWLEQDETGIVTEEQLSHSPSHLGREAIANYEPITLLVRNKSPNPPIMDLFTMKSTIPGFVSYRWTQKSKHPGSQFIQMLCEKMETEYGSKTIETLPQARPLQNILWEVQDLISKKYHESFNYRQTIMSEDYVTKFIKFCQPV